MKFSIDDLLKNPILIMIVLIVGTGLTVFLNQNYASVSLLEQRIKETKDIQLQESGRLQYELGEIKNTMRDINENILEIYKMVKYQEGRDEKKQR